MMVPPDWTPDPVEDVGMYWPKTNPRTHWAEMAHNYWDTEDLVEVVVKASITWDQVNWVETFLARLAWGDEGGEDEVRLFKRSKVRILDVKKKE